MQQIPSWYFDSLQRSGKFLTRTSLREKVDEEGKLKPFHGESAVFLLPDELKSALAQVQEELYAAAGGMLMKKPLSQDNLHMTLHDLWNVSDGERCASPPYEAEEVCRIIEGIRKYFPERIMMRAIVPMNMVNTSVVMGLMPASEPDAWCLAEMHKRFSVLYPRTYGLTPHITLAYYCPGEYGEEIWTRLKDVFTVKGYAFPLYTRDLVFRRFKDMDDYETIY